MHGKVRSVYFEVRKEEEEEQERDGFVAVSWELNKAKVSCVSSMSGEREKGTQETDTSNLTLNDIHTSLVTHYGRLNVPLNFLGGQKHTSFLSTHIQLSYMTTHSQLHSHKFSPLMYKIKQDILNLVKLEMCSFSILLYSNLT